MSEAPRPAKGSARPRWDEAASEFIDAGRRAVARAERIISGSIARDAEIDTPAPRMSGGWG